MEFAKLQLSEQKRQRFEEGKFLSYKTYALETEKKVLNFKDLQELFFVLKKPFKRMSSRLFFAFQQTIQ